MIDLISKRCPFCFLILKLWASFALKQDRIVKAHKNYRNNIQRILSLSLQLVLVLKISTLSVTYGNFICLAILVFNILLLCKLKNTINILSDCSTSYGLASYFVA